MQVELCLEHAASEEWGLRKVKTCMVESNLRNCCSLAYANCSIVFLSVPIFADQKIEYVWLHGSFSSSFHWFCCTCRKQMYRDVDLWQSSVLFDCDLYFLDTRSQLSVIHLNGNFPFLNSVWTIMGSDVRSSFVQLVSCGTDQLHIDSCTVQAQFDCQLIFRGCKVWTLNALLEHLLFLFPVLLILCPVSSFIVLILCLWCCMCFATYLWHSVQFHNFADVFIPGCSSLLCLCENSVALSLFPCVWIGRRTAEKHIASKDFHMPWILYALPYLQDFSMLWIAYALPGLQVEGVSWVGCACSRAGLTWVWTLTVVLEVLETSV